MITDQATRNKIIQKSLALARQKIETHYSDKFTYALPEWAMLSGNPVFVALLQIHGSDGIQISQSRVDFHVDFSDEQSILFYVEFLQKKMDTKLPVCGYVLFYKNILMMQKEQNYTAELTALQNSEIDGFNKNSTDFEYSLLILNTTLETISSTAHLQA